MLPELEITENEAYEIPVVSFSQLQSWDRCEFQWYLNYHLGYVPVAKKRALEIGSKGHEALKDFYEKALETPDYNPLTWVEKELPNFASAWVEEADSADDFTNAGLLTWLLMRYMNVIGEPLDYEHKIVSVEEHFLLPMTTPKGRDFLIQGYTDLVTEDQQGRIFLWDHKFVGNFWSPIEVIMDSQTPTYGAAMRDQGRNVFGIIINQLRTYDYKNKNAVTNEQLFKREVTYRTSRELDSIKMETGSMVDELVERHRDPRRSLKKDCKLCSYQEPCLLSMKGIPVETILSETFKKRNPRVQATQQEGEEPHGR